MFSAHEEDYGKIEDSVKIIKTIISLEFVNVDILSMYNLIHDWYK